MMILGAGLSGLIAATQIPDAVVLEANSEEMLSHRAVLRFRSDVLSRMTGIPFKKVTVRKSIWSNGQHCAPNLQLANWYSLKTNGGVLDRSIWNIEPVERFIAPENLQQQMAAMIGPRIKWKRQVEYHMFKDMPTPIISTIPMPVLLSMLVPLPNPVSAEPEFKHQAICVDRYRVPGADVYQTVYFPDHDTNVYRASITGDLLIVERRKPMAIIGDPQPMKMLEPFGLKMSDVTPIDENHVQRYGKISPIDDRWRRDMIHHLTQQFGIYSLGRFAIWHNILLDDVAHDVAVIKRLIQQGPYSAALHHSKDRT